MITKMKEKIKKWCQGWRHSENMRKASRVEMDFRVSERDGRIYLTHLGFAFAKMPLGVTAAEIANELNNARNAALEYEGL